MKQQTYGKFIIHICRQSWAKGDAYASSMVHHNNRFYWFVAVSHATIPGKAIGVALSDKAAGGFQRRTGKILSTHDMLPALACEKANLDPSVLISYNGEAYLYWGNQRCYFPRLKPDLLSTEGPISIIARNLPKALISMKGMDGFISLTDMNIRRE